MGHKTIRKIRRNVAKVWGPDFPEQDYLPSPEFAEEYALRVELGRLRCKDATLQIVGAARDIESQVYRTLYTIEKIGALFKDYQVVIYEGDSEDRSYEILLQRTQQNSRYTILSKNLEYTRLYDLTPSRFKVMADVRNQYVDYYKENLFGDFICVLDLDFRGPVSSDGILNSFGYAGRWDVVTSNGLDAVDNYYFDMAVYCPESFDELLVEQKPGAQYPNLKKGAIRPSYTRGEPLAHVRSAFGGMAFYTRTAFLSGRYNETRCDHISFHEQLYRQGFDSIVVNPSQILIR